MTASTETLDISTELAPQALPYPANPGTQLGADSPKREATELYLKSKALLESRRKRRRGPFHPSTADVWICLGHRCSSLNV